MECERLIPHSNSWRKWKVKCVKPAVGLDENNRNLCVKCLRKHNEKSKRHQVKQK